MSIVATGQVTLVDLTDAYSVMLTSDSYVFPGSTAAAIAGSATTMITALRGADVVPVSVTLANVTAPTGITVTKDTNTTTPTLTITADTSFTTPGTVTIPVSITGTDIVVNKKFAVGIAFTGAQGVPGAKGEPGTTYYTYIRYATDGSGSGMTATPSTSTTYIGICISSATTAPTTASSYSWSKYVGNTGETGPGATNAVIGNESVTIPCDKDGLVSTATNITIPFAGYIGSARAAATIAASGLPSGVTAGTNTAATTSANGSLILVFAKSATLGGTATGNITLTITCNGLSFVKMFTWSKALTGATGAQGNPGSDALVLTVTSSNGFIFKNSSISTTLTAHLYKAGVELTSTQIAALGTIKWYKNGSTTAESTTGASITIDTGSVTNSANYIASLESA